MHSFTNTPLAGRLYYLCMQYLLYMYMYSQSMSSKLIYIGRVPKFQQKKNKRNRMWVLAVWFSLVYFARIGTVQSILNQQIWRNVEIFLWELTRCEEKKKLWCSAGVVQWEE